MSEPVNQSSAESALTMERVVLSYRKAGKDMPKTAKLLGVSRRTLEEFIESKPALKELLSEEQRIVADQTIEVSDDRKTEDTAISSAVTGMPEPPQDAMQKMVASVSAPITAKSKEELVNELVGVGIDMETIGILQTAGAFEGFSASALASQLSQNHAMTRVAAVQLFQDFLGMSEDIKDAETMDEKMHIVRTRAVVLDTLNKTQDRSMRGTEMMLKIMGKKNKEKKPRRIQ